MLLTNELAKMISVLESYSKNLKSKKKNKSTSAIYLDSIAGAADDLNDALVTIGKVKISKNALENVHYRFSLLQKDLSKTSAAILPSKALHTATLNYKPTRKKLKYFSEQLLNCEKEFSFLVFSDQIRNLIVRLSKIKFKNKLENADNIDLKIYYPAKKLGHYNIFKFATHFESNDSMIKLQVAIEDALSLIKEITKSESDSLYKELASFRKQMTKECGVCFDEKEISEFVSLPCGHPYCRECVAEIIKTDPRCPECRQPIPTSFKI